MTEQNQSADFHTIRPRPLEVGVSATELIEATFCGAGAGLIADTARHFTDLILSHPGAFVGLSVDELLTPGGHGVSTLLPLLKGGYVDWLAVSGTNLYFDALFALGKPLLRVPGSGRAPDAVYDDCGGNIFIRRSDREDAEATLAEIFSGPDFQQLASTAELNRLLGRELRAKEKELGVRYPCLLSTAYELGVPIYNPAPADGPLCSLIASLAFVGNRLSIDPNQDLNESAGIFNEICHKGQPACIWSFGNGAAAAFAGLIPEHLDRILGSKRQRPYQMHFILENGANRIEQLLGETRLKTTGKAATATADDSQLSDNAGADTNPVESINAPLRLIIDTDLSCTVPLLTAYILDRIPTRPLKRLGAKRDQLVDNLRKDRLANTLKDLQQP